MRHQRPISIFIGCLFLVPIFLVTKLVAQQPVKQSIPVVIPSTPTERTYAVNAVINLTITTKNATCQLNNGQIIVEASGGIAPYTYALSNGWVLGSGHFVFLDAGNYIVTVTDNNGDVATASATITNSFSPPSLIVNFNDYQPAPGCTGSDASVTFTTIGGTPPYQYTFDNINYQTSNVFSNLHSGMYEFIVKDANGCTDYYSSSFMNFFTSPTCDMTLSFTYVPVTCINTGSISDIPSSPLFVYSIDGINYQPDLNFRNLTPGIHIIYYKKISTGQVQTFAFAVRKQCYVEISYLSVDAACQQMDGTITITASNGTAPYQYTIDGINYQVSNVFTGLASGTYFVTVRDASGVTSSQGAVVYDKCPIVTLAATDESCPLNDGTITATATKGTPPYQYSIDGISFQTSNIFTGLTTGPYTVRLKDALGFTATADINVSYYCLSVTATAVNVVCGNMNGSIIATGSGGTAPYLYSIDGITFQSSNTFTGLGASSYAITIKDALNHTATTNVLITDSPGPLMTYVLDPPSCSLNDGTITINATDGTPPFQYSIDNINFQSANVFTNIAHNYYTVAVRDANGCGVSMFIHATASCPAIATTITHATCGNVNGRIEITVTNAIGPYEYSIDGVNFQVSNIFMGLGGGIYTITVRDAHGHTNTATITINDSCPVVTATATNEICGNANGIITATGSQGMPPYEFTIDGINFQTNPVFANLAAGPYTVGIRDASGVITTTTTTIINIPGPRIATGFTPATCVNNNATISITGTGGTAPLQYSLTGTGFQSNNSFINLPSGTYHPVVKDANGCISSEPVIVTLTNDLMLQAGAELTICEGDNIMLPAISNGITIVWAPAVTLNNSQLLNPIASPVSTTKYYVNATLGACSEKDSVLVIVNPAPDAIAGNSSTICKGQNSQLNGSGGVAYSWTPLSYLSDPSISNPVVTNPPASVTYHLEVTDANGCNSLQRSSVTIYVTTTTKVFSGNDTSIVMNQPFGLNAVDVNNSGFIEYNWSPSYGLNDPGVQKPITTLDRDVTYLVTATTASGCIATDEVKIKVYIGPEIYVPTAFSPDNDGLNDILKAIPVGIKTFKHFVVYNRWGQQIFYTTDPNRGWDGRIKGVEQDTGTFVWIAEGKDGKGNIIQKKGSVTLIR